VQSVAVTPAGKNAMTGPESGGSAPEAHITAQTGFGAGTRGEAPALPRERPKPAPDTRCPSGAAGDNNSGRQRDGALSLRVPDESMDVEHAPERGSRSPRVPCSLRKELVETRQRAGLSRAAVPASWPCPAWQRWAAPCTICSELRACLPQRDCCERLRARAIGCCGSTGNLGITEDRLI
jgi:hypothetical protein